MQPPSARTDILPYASQSPYQPGDIAFIASSSPRAQDALHVLTDMYGNCAPEDASVLVPLGGDGFMLESIHKYLHLQKPLFGMNRGTVGFLMNKYDFADLPARLAQADHHRLAPLVMNAACEDGTTQTALAFNEVSLLRQSRQVAQLSIFVNNELRLETLMCDGVLVSTDAGSTAYNFSAYGPIIPLGSPLIALTPISPFRPRRWRGALLPDSVTVQINVASPLKRPVAAVADHTEVRNIRGVKVSKSASVFVTLLFDSDHNLDERILREQFSSI